MIDIAIEAAADALRRYQQAHIQLRPWHLIEESQRRTWRIKVQIVLDAYNEAKRTGKRSEPNG